MNAQAEQYLGKIERFCTYQERCLKEVKNKISTYDINPESKAELLDYLIENRYVDDARFVGFFVRSKSNQKNWGFNKIRFALRGKGISEELIKEAFLEIDQEQYRTQLEHILQSKKIKEEDPQKRKIKLAQFAIQRGFEPQLVWQVLKELDL